MLLLVPLGMVFWRTFEHGFWPAFHAVTAPDARSALWLTILIALIVVPANTIFGVVCALDRPRALRRKGDRECTSRSAAGQVLLDGEDETGRPPQRRGVGFVFQHYTAFRHMTVYENVAFGLRVRRRPRREIRGRVEELLHLVQLEGLAKRYPAQLSGGQRQRMGLARALAVDPSVLLLDEPFDARVRKELRRWLRRLQDETHTTTLIVTHDQEEAMDVADQIVLMNHGRVEQVGGPRDRTRTPRTNS